MDNSNKKISLCEMIVYAMMVVAVIYVIVQSILGNNSELHFKITLGIWILAAVVISDFIAPMLDKRFEKVGEKAAMLYLGYAIMDALAFTGVYIFIINVNMTKEPLHYAFLAFSVMMFLMKTFIYNKYQVESGRNMEAAFAEEEDLESESADEVADETDDSREDNGDDESREGEQETLENLDDIEVNTLDLEEEEEIKEMIFRKREK